MSDKYTPSTIRFIIVPHDISYETAVRTIQTALSEANIHHTILQDLKECQLVEIVFDSEEDATIYKLMDVDSTISRRLRRGN